jgi:hypothetical protein
MNQHEDPLLDVEKIIKDFVELVDKELQQFVDNPIDIKKTMRALFDIYRRHGFINIKLRQEPESYQIHIESKFPDPKKIVEIWGKPPYIVEEDEEEAE